MSAADYTAIQAQVDAGFIRLSWTGLPEYKTGTLYVGSVALFETWGQPRTIYVDPLLGNNQNLGFSPTEPVADMYRAILIAQSWGKDAIIKLVGAQTIAASTRFFFSPGSQGGLATPLTFISDFADQLGTLVSNAATATTAPLAANIPNIRQVTNASITGTTGSSTAAKMTVTTPTSHSWTSADVDKMVAVSGAATTGNNEIFTIESVPNNTTLVLYNAQGSAGVDANNGAITITDSYRGASIRFTGASAANVPGNERIIGSNTLTAFSWNEPMSPAPAATDSFVVERPGSVITHNDLLTLQTPANTFMGFQGIKFKAQSASGTAALAFLGLNAFFDRCEISGTGGVRSLSVFNRTIMNPNTLWQNNASTHPLSPASRSPRLFMHDLTLSINDARMLNRYVTTQVRVDHAGSRGYSLQFTAPFLDARRTTLDMDNDSTVNLATTAAGSSARLNGALLATDAPLMMRRGARVIANRLDISNSPTSAMFLDDGCEVDADILTGSGNARYVFEMKGKNNHVKRTPNTTATGTLGFSIVGPIANPSAPAVTNLGTPGTTSYSYKIVAQRNGLVTAASAVATTTTGNAVLDGTNKNHLVITADPGADTYLIYRTASAGTPSSTGLIGTTTALTFDDTGLAGDSATPSASNVTGFVRSTSQIPFSETELETVLTGAAAAIGSSNNVTGLTNMDPSVVGSQLVIAGSGTSANNDTHLIIKYVSATSVIVASTLVADAGPVSWSLKSNRSTGNIIE